ncbi:MAG: hypothetical protein QM627_03175 [Luteolibacter sp.]
MKFFRSGIGLATLLCVLAVGGIGGWLFYKVRSLPVTLRSEMSWEDALRYQNVLGLEMSSAEKRARVHRAVSRMTDDVEREFPLLKIEFRSIPEDRNGFLQLYRFAKKYDTSDPVFAGLKEFTGQNGSSWDAEKAKRWLEENATLVEEIERIAVMKDRSLSGMPDDYAGFLGGGVVYAANAMIVKARLAADAKDEERSLHWIGAAQNIASHLRETEAPTLLAETMNVLIDQNIHRVVFEDLLPAFGRDADLTKWRSVLAVRNYNPEELSKVIRGEWYTMSRVFFPLLLAQGSDELPDPENFLKCYASLVHDRMSWLEGASLVQLRDLEMLDEGKIKGVSKKGRELMTIAATGAKPWMNGYCTVAPGIASYRAAMDLLILEKQEGALSKESPKAVTLEPLSGVPFVLDVDKRQLLPPATGEEYPEALQLPW